MGELAEATQDDALIDLPVVQERQDQSNGQQDASDSDESTVQDQLLLPVNMQPDVVLPLPSLAQAPTASGYSRIDAEQFASLVEQHVERLLLSDSTQPGGTGTQAVITLKDSLFEKTSFLLTRTEQGWNLQAASLGQEGVQQLRQYTGSLVKRFAVRGLGRIEVDWATTEIASPVRRKSDAGLKDG